MDAAVIRALSEEINAASFHMSGKKTLGSEMVYRNDKVHMGLPGLSEFEVYRTDLEKIKEAKSALDG